MSHNLQYYISFFIQALRRKAGTITKTEKKKKKKPKRSLLYMSSQLLRPGPSHLLCGCLGSPITGDSWKGLFGLTAGRGLQIFSAAGRAQQWVVLPEPVLCPRDWGETSETSLLLLYLQNLGCKHNACNYVASWVFIMPITGQSRH